MFNPDAPPPPGVPSFSTQEELEALLLEGLNSGDPVEATPEFWAELRSDIERDRLQRRKAS